jgi:hypothetical protein
MHSTNFKTIVVAGVLTLTLAGVVIWQRQALSVAREENSRLRAQIVQPPAAELSRQETTESSAILEKIDSLYKTGEVELARQEALLANGQKNVADTPLFMQTLAEGKVEDAFLKDLVEVQQQAADKLARLEKGGASAAELAELRRQIDHLEKKIQERSQGVLMGLKVRRDSTSIGLKNLLAEREKLAAAK